MKKKSIMTVLTLALTLSALTGCGSKNDTVVDKNEDVIQEVSDTVETETKEDKTEENIKADTTSQSVSNIEKLLAEAGMDTSWAESLNSISEENGYGQVVEVASAENNSGWGEVKAAVFEDGTALVIGADNSWYFHNDLDDPNWNENTKFVDYSNWHYGDECELTFEELAILTESEIKTVNKTAQMNRTADIFFDTPGTKLLYTNRATTVGYNGHVGTNVHTSFDTEIPDDEMVTVLRSMEAPCVISDDATGTYTWYEFSYNDNIYYWFDCFNEEDL